MTNAKAVEVRLELKVCERCGALWCRIVGSNGKQCGKCVAAQRYLPVFVAGKGRPRHGCAGNLAISRGER